MLKINIDTKKLYQTLEINGDPITVASEIAMVISQIYDSLKKQDQLAGAVFRMAIQGGLTDDSPVWNEQAEGTKVTINLSKRPGGGADRSE